jgi:DNA-directed RNA polymerase specialized sigma24 family protein
MRIASVGEGGDVLGICRYNHIGLSYGEAAEICQVPVGTIRSRVARARTDLIQLLQAERAASS